jgi:hypothetical protein
MNNNIFSDDGTLAFLRLGKNPDRVWFHCKQVKQSQLEDETFYVLDYMEAKKTRYGEGRVVVLIGDRPNEPEKTCKKFFSNSTDIKYVLSKLRELNKFPRKVTLRKYERGGYYFE